MGKRGPRSINELMSIGFNRSLNRADREKPAPPPGHLSESSQALWDAIVKARRFEPQDNVTLQCALEALDRAEQARLALLEFGLVYTDGKGMVRSRPEVAVERDSRAAYLRAMRELHLESPRGPELAKPWDTERRS